MKTSDVSSYIDRSIYRMLGVKDFDTTRQDLYTTSMRMRSTLDSNIDMDSFEINDQNLNQIPVARTKYCIFYIYHTENRITDLYKAEHLSKKFKISCDKAFQMLLFKEKLQRDGEKPKNFKRYLRFSIESK